MSRSVSICAQFLIAAAALCWGNARAAPGVAQQLAESYAASHRAEKAPSGKPLVDEYADWFFRGFTHPDGGIQTKFDVDREAYTAGQAYWRDRPKQRDEIFSGYGYVRVEREGVLSAGFERSVFVPVDATAEQWWCTSFGGRRWSDLTPGQPAPDNNARVRVEGYLSSPGHYGHLGAYAREILVTSFTILP